MGKIEIEGMAFYAFHGHFEEEQIVGNKFLVSISLETDTSKAEKSDNLHDALDYQIVYRIIKEQMEIKSYLLENIASRIMNKLFETFNCIESATLKVSKINPPMGGQIQKVSITLKRPE
jgi:7,8-dihydroneopterin aldolase/epimerase/oxygenase